MEIGMFESLRALFKKPEPYKTPLPEADAQHAMGALLVRVAKADKTVLFEEIKVIDQVLSKRYGLNPVEASKMRASCQLLESEMPDTEEMTELMKDTISVEEKEATLIALWSVVYADGVKHAHEDALLHQIEALLGVSPERAIELQAAAQS
jgi:uncharacterized tellurite resistance protein B-like protein